METAALAAFAAACVTVITLKRRAAGPAPSSNLGGPLVPVGNTEHDVRRKAALAFARALDHTSNVKIIQNKSFDIDKTIFHSLTGDFRKAMSVKFGQIPDFSEDRAKEIKAAYSRASKTICPVVNIETSITQFMNEDCDFKMEHADGSFKDHLAFFMDYCNAYYPNHSPRVGLLHSIMGVGTNFFPMTKEKIPKLFSMLTPEEITHIQSFPSILRLVFATNLMQQLTAVYTEKVRLLESPRGRTRATRPTPTLARASSPGGTRAWPVCSQRAGVSLERIDFHRVIDNKRVRRRPDCCLPCLASPLSLLLA